MLNQANEKLSKEEKRLKHNLHLLEILELGDLVEYKREIYSHWAVYIGNGKIIHLSGPDERKVSGIGLLSANVTNLAEIRIDHFLDVIKNSYAYRNNSKDNEFTPLPSDQILTRALSKIGCHYYDLLTFNCEHFANYCRYDLKFSDQSTRIIRFGCIVTNELRNINNYIKDLFIKPAVANQTENNFLLDKPARL